jgi:glycerol-3-phosphate acyltransferase PlsY
VILLFSLLGAYLLGAIPFGFLAGRLRGVDVRRAGSGNIGATNVWRLLGPATGLVVLGLDLAKGALPLLLWRLGGRGEGWAEGALALAPVLGHVFSPFLRFRGGKGVATAAGAFFSLLPFTAPWGVAFFLIPFLAFRYVSLGSLSATVAVAAVALFRASPERSLPVLLAAGLIFWTHRENIRRLVRGEEPRFSLRGSRK